MPTPTTDHLLSACHRVPVRPDGAGLACSHCGAEVGFVRVGEHPRPNDNVLNQTTGGAPQVFPHGYTLTGHTYPHRKAIRSAGGDWNKERKEWVMPTEESRRRMQALVNGPPSAPRDEQGVGGTHAHYAAKLSEMQLRLEALSLALVNATEETALPLAHKIGSVLSDLSRN